MHLTPENAPVGAVVAVHNGMAEKVIKIRQWDEGHFRAIWPGGMLWRDGTDVQFVRRLDQQEPVKASMVPTREDLRSGKIRWLWRMSSDVPFSTVTVGCHDSGTGWPYVLITRGDGCTWFVDVGNYEWGGPAEETTATPGDSVTIERDRAAMDALRRLAAKAMGISRVSDDVNVESLEAVVRARLGCIERELSVLHDFRRASERLPGEGDVVEWNIAFEWAYEYLDIVVAKQSGRGSPLWQLATDDDDRVVSFSVKAPHPDLYPVRVDGVWRWQRKEKV